MRARTIRKKVFDGIFKRHCLGDWNCYIITGVPRTSADRCPYVEECKKIAHKRVVRIQRNNRKRLYGDKR